MHFIIAYYNIIIIIIMHFYFRDPTIPQICFEIDIFQNFMKYLKMLHIFLAVWSIKGRVGMFGLYSSSARLH